jgi:hypothetical protein
VSTLLVACSDGRLRDTLADFERELDAETGFRILVPGGPLVLTAAAPEHDAALGWLELLVARQNVHTIYLVSHQHCLAYERLIGGFFHDERDTLARDLRAVRDLLASRFYGVTVHCFVIPWIDAGGEGDFGAAEPLD